MAAWKRLANFSTASPTDGAATVVSGAIVGVTELPTTLGGTGAGTFTDGGVIIGNATGTLSVTGAGTSGQLLQSGGAGVDPAYTTATYPTTATANRFIAASGSNVWADTTPATALTYLSGQAGASFSMNSQKITGLAAGTATGEAVRWDEFNAAIVGLSWKESAHLMATGNIALTGVVSVDGTNSVTGDRIAAFSQTTTTQDGMYVANDSGAWTRALDFPVGADVSSYTFFVEEGATNADGGFTITNNQGSAVVGTDDLVVAQVSSVSVVDTLDELTDVTITAAATGEILRHNGSSWVDSTTTWTDSVTSGGVLYGSAANAVSSSGALTDSVVMVGGGAGAAPSSLAAGLGTTTTVLHGNAAGEPTWGAVVLGDTTGIAGDGANSNITSMTGITGDIATPTTLTLADTGSIRGPSTGTPTWKATAYNGSAQQTLFTAVAAASDNGTFLQAHRLAIHGGDTWTTPVGTGVGTTILPLRSNSGFLEIFN